MPEITVKSGKTFTVGAKTFQSGIVIPERIIKVYQVKKYQEFYEKTFITLEEYLKQDEKKVEKKAEEDSEDEEQTEPTPVVKYDRQEITDNELESDEKLDNFLENSKDV